MLSGSVADGSNAYGGSLNLVHGSEVLDSLLSEGSYIEGSELHGVVVLKLVLELVIGMGLVDDLELLRGGLLEVLQGSMAEGSDVGGGKLNLVHGSEVFNGVIAEFQKAVG